MSTTANDIKAKIEELQAKIRILNEMFANEVDIHTHTRAIGQHFRKFYEADETYRLSAHTQNIDAVIQEILGKCSSTQLPNVSRVLTTIKATTVPDPETNTNLQDLLIRTWSFVKKPGIYSNCVELILKNLDHNIITGGGCVPGIAARLIQPYAHFVLHMLTLSCQNQASSLPNSDLERAIALSLIDAQKPKKMQVSREEEEAFQLALYRSKVDQDKRQLTTRSTQDNEEDYEMQLAIALSKSTFDH